MLNVFRACCSYRGKELFKTLHVPQNYDMALLVVKNPFLLPTGGYGVNHGFGIPCGVDDFHLLALRALHDIKQFIGKRARHEDHALQINAYFRTFGIDDFVPYGLRIATGTNIAAKDLS